MARSYTRPSGGYIESTDECPYGKKWDEKTSIIKKTYTDKCKFSTCANCNSPTQCKVDGGNCPDPFNLECLRNPENNT